jgi:hypothetical protein
MNGSLNETTHDRRMRCVSSSTSYREASQRLAEYGDIIGTDTLRRWVSKVTMQPASVALKEAKGESEEARQIAIMNAQTIREYWKAKGHNVKARAVYRERIWTVESDLVNGLPR